MRREKKFGVYSNKTIKRCFCEISAQVERYYEEHRLHQIGVGRLDGNSKFVQFDKRSHFKANYSRCEHQDRKHQKRQENKKISEEGKKYFYLTNF